MTEYVSKSSSTPCGIIDGYPLIENEQVYEILRRGCIPASRPTDELVRYTRALEHAISAELPHMPWELIHENLCPHWIDLLEENGAR